MSGGSSQWMYQAEGYQIENSLRFNDGDVAELLWPASAHSGGNRRTFTHSFWTKRGVVTSTHQVLFEARDGDGGSSDNIKWENGQLAVIYQDGTLGRLKSTALFRDSSAWYHIVVAVDTTQGTNTNRIKVYVNGVQLTSFTGTNAVFSHAVGVLPERAFNRVSKAELMSANTVLMPPPSLLLA